MGLAPSAAEAWFVLPALTLQIFLDFSAYADMAIGLGRMVGINLPINFDEPLKAVNRFDLWRRWHITFVTFMRANVFMPLVRHAHLPAVAALFVTVLLGGLWHGLGWTFLLWSFLQAALMLVIHLRPRRGDPAEGGRLALLWAIGSTFFITCLLSAVFRAPSIDALGLLLGALVGVGGVTLSRLEPTDYAVLAAAFATIWLLPDAQRFFARYWTALEPRPDAPRPTAQFPLTRRLRFELNGFWGAAMAILLIAALSRAGWPERFIYVQF
jgi:D-alanyl-lipoteichoic acid acyltransferase DltB (MBOAT superfamily)